MASFWFRKKQEGFEQGGRDSLNKIFSLPQSFCYAKIQLPRQREARHKPVFFIVHRLTSFESRDYRVVFDIQKSPVNYLPTGL